MTDTPGLPKLERAQTLDELAYRQIKEAIMNGIFGPGEFVAEVVVAQELGISKTPVRKAMGRLQQERFLVNVPFEGYYVAEISVKDIIEVYELRSILECYVIGQTVDKFAPAELTDLEGILSASDEALAKGDYRHQVALNRKFHHSFDRKHGNRRISDMLVHLDEHVHRILLRAVSAHGAELEASHREHHMILGAVKEADADAAVHLMRRHLECFRDLLVDSYSQG